MAIAHGLPVTTSTSVRESEWPIEVMADVASAVRRDRELETNGTLAVIAVQREVHALHESLAAEFGELVGLGSEGLATPITVLSAQEAKGLEFDSVVIVDPSAIIADTERGAAALYVAMTRPTQRLTLVSTGPLPAGL